MIRLGGECLQCLNSQLPWDGSCLGIFRHQDNFTQGLIEALQAEGRFNPLSILVNYDYVYLRHSKGYVVGQLLKYDAFTYIVEALRPLFNLSPRGCHHLIYQNRQYTLLYVPVTPEGLPVYETPLSQLDSNHKLRAEADQDIRKILLFHDILNLKMSNEAKVIFRQLTADHPTNLCWADTGGEYAVVSNNHNLPLRSECKRDAITRATWHRWFPDTDILRDTFSQIVPEYPVGTSRFHNMLFDLRERLDNIIKEHDVQRAYRWYPKLIIANIVRYACGVLT